MDDAIEDYASIEAHRPSFRTKVNQLRAWRSHLEGRLSRPARLRDVSPELVEAYLADLRAKGRTAATRNRYLSAIKSLLGRAVERRRIPYNPLSCLRQEVEDNIRERVLSDAEQERLLRRGRTNALRP